PVLACWERRRAPAPDLEAPERRVPTVDGLDHVEDRDVGGRAGQAGGPAPPRPCLQEPRPRPPLQVLRPVRPGGGVVRRRSGRREGGPGRQDRENHAAVEPPRDALREAHIPDTRYPE